MRGICWAGRAVAEREHKLLSFRSIEKETGMTNQTRFIARRLSVATAVAAALAASGGVALAQQQSGYVTSGADKSIVRSGFGECVRAGMAGPVAAVERLSCSARAGSSHGRAKVGSF